jgi:uncharacterized membrane protein
VALDTPEAIVARADEIRTVVANRVMPLGNRTGMTDEERDLVVRWVEQGASEK